MPKTTKTATQLKREIAVSPVRRIRFVVIGGWGALLMVVAPLHGDHFGSFLGAAHLAAAFYFLTSKPT